jgi:hypothetical protein
MLAEVECFRRDYKVEVLNAVKKPSDAPRLVIIGYQPNEQTQNLLRMCIDSFRAFTPEPHELWVVDNASPPGMADWLREESGINVIINHTRPRPVCNIWERLTGSWKSDPYLGSYSNAVGLQLAAEIISPETRYIATFHQDTAVCHPGWLTYMLSLFHEGVGGVGFRLDTSRVRTLHILGALFDFQLIQKLNLSFLHNMPHYDVGDGISVGLEKAGYRLRATQNTHATPELIESIPQTSPFHNLPVDRAFDNKGNLLFMHLGRGVVKSEGKTPEGKCSPREWVHYLRANLLQ